MSDIQAHRTTQVKNTVEALRKNRISMASLGWRRTSIEPMAETTEKVRVRYERVWGNRQALYEEIKKQEQLG